jgi:uncharacterized membrane protein YphA (DoxX/SURF4 family)
MSVDTRTPRSGFDDQPALSMVKVHCDPAQVIVNHASFRVRLAPTAAPRPARAVSDAARTSAGAGRRRAPVVWSGRSAPGDAGTTGLLQAVRRSTLAATPAGEEYGYDTAGTTQVIPRVDLSGETRANPAAGGRGTGRPLLPPMRQAVGAYDQDPSGPREYDDEPDDEPVTTVGRAPGRPGDSVRHAWYPGRRMELGVVLLPLRVLLGFISIYTGMGKLCDPVYFDGGERGSMVKWLNSLQPWQFAEPLRDFALSHPVGAGLTVAFLQVVVGVLTVLGLWQRVAAVVGVLLSAALLLTVTWRTVPVYDAPDIIYLAAWSPLVIAGAPVYSVDGRLANEAWRRLGPRSELWELRRRVYRRGGLVAALVVGLTLLVGSVLGGAVRSTEMVTVPRPNQDPTNYLPGAALPQDRPSAGPVRKAPKDGAARPAPKPSASAKPKPQSSAPVKEKAPEAPRTGAGPSETKKSGAGQQTPDRSTPAARPADGGNSGPAKSSVSGAPGTTDTGSSAPGGGSSGGGSDSGSTESSSGGVIGGLLG